MKPTAAIIAAWLCLAAPPRGEAPVGTIADRYVSGDKDHGIELYLRGEDLHGRIAWTKDPNITDRQNADVRLRGRKLAGIEHIRGFTQGGDGVWTGGTLYNPEDGKTYEAKLWLEGRNRLVIQGRPKVPLLGGVLGRLFGRIVYMREARP